MINPVLVIPRMLIEGIVSPEPVLASVGPDGLVVSVQNSVFGGRSALVPLG